MRKARFKEEQIIRILREAEAGRLTAAAVRRKHGISEQTFYRWRQKYGGMEVSDARRLKELEVENQRPKWLVAERARAQSRRVRVEPLEARGCEQEAAAPGRVASRPPTGGS